MMKEVKAIISRYYDAFNRQDVTSLLDCLSDDVVHDINQGEREIGKSLFANFIKHMNECYQESIQDLVIFVAEDGSRAAAEFFVEGIYIKTDDGLYEARGQKYRLPVGAFFELKNDKITRVTNYYNLRNWLKQIEIYV
jgi:steroid delta-isomerase-like uncharacterized protein